MLNMVEVVDMAVDMVVTVVVAMAAMVEEEDTMAAEVEDTEATAVMAAVTVRLDPPKMNETRKKTEQVY